MAPKQSEEPETRPPEVIVCQRSVNTTLFALVLIKEVAHEGINEVRTALALLGNFSSRFSS